MSYPNDEDFEHELGLLMFASTLILFIGFVLGFFFHAFWTVIA